MKRTTPLPSQPKGPLGDNPKGNYFHAMYPIFEEAFWHLPAKERLFWWVYRMTFGFFNKRELTYRLCTTLPPSDTLAAALDIGQPSYLYALVSQLCEEGRILRWHHQRKTLLAVNPLPLREEPPTAADLQALLAMTPGPHLRVTRTGEVVDSRQPQDEAEADDPAELPTSEVITALRRQHAKRYPDAALTLEDETKGLPRAAKMLSEYLAQWHRKDKYRDVTIAQLVQTYTAWMHTKYAEEGWDTPPHGGTYSSTTLFKQFKRALAEDEEVTLRPIPTYVVDLGRGASYAHDEDGYPLDAVDEL